MPRNAYAHTIHLSVPGGLSFPSHELFRAIEDIASWTETASPSLDDEVVRSLRHMLAQLHSYGIHGYWRLKAYMNYHSDLIRRARRSRKAAEQDGSGIGIAWLLAQGNKFRELARAYFDVAKTGEEGVRRHKRKGMVISI